jgi:hypothetical protein
LDLDLQNIMVPGAKEILKRGLTLGAGQKALKLAALTLALEEENNQRRAGRRLGLTPQAVAMTIEREESLARFRKKAEAK